MAQRRLTLRGFCAAVREAVESLPAGFHPYLENVAVDVFEEPSESDLKAIDERDDSDRASLLLGLFIGVPVTKQSYGDHLPNQIKIFRRPMEQVSRTHDDLIHNIRAVLIHEMAHHFGFSEEDLEEFERKQQKYRK